MKLWKILDSVMLRIKRFLWIISICDMWHARGGSRTLKPVCHNITFYHYATTHGYKVSNTKTYYTYF